MHKIVVYSKPGSGCSLCVEAREELERVRRDIPFTLEEIDIQSDPALLDTYGQRIPVVTMNDTVIFEYFVDASQLRKLLKEVKE